MEDSALVCESDIMNRKVRLCYVIGTSRAIEWDSEVAIGKIFCDRVAR